MSEKPEKRTGETTKKKNNNSSWELETIYHSYYTKQKKVFLVFLVLCVCEHALIITIKWIRQKQNNKNKEEKSTTEENPEKEKNISTKRGSHVLKATHSIFFLF